jgi:hypothetical protein
MRPSEIIIPRAKKCCFLLPNFKAITWRGVIYCKKRVDVNTFNASDSIDSNFKSHETIHIRQAQSMNDCWFRFYFNYVWNWIKNIPLMFVDIHAAYKLIPVEIEAYLYQNDWHYAEVNKPVYEWKTFQKLSLKQKRKIAKLFYKTYRRRKSYTEVLYDIFIAKTEEIGSDSI